MMKLSLTAALLLKQYPNIFSYLCIKKSAMLLNVVDFFPFLYYNIYIENKLLYGLLSYEKI